MSSLEYASAFDDANALRRRLRQVVGWVAIAYGSMMFAKDAITWLQFAGILSGFGGFTFDSGLATDWIEVVPRLLGQWGLVVGGILLLSNCRFAMWVLRGAAMTATSGFAAVQVMYSFHIIGPGRDTSIDSVTRALFIWEQSAPYILLALMPVRIDTLTGNRGARVIEGLSA